MKTIILLLSSVLALNGCNASKQASDNNIVAQTEKTQESIPTLKYEEISRGFARIITLEKGVATLFSRKLNAGEETTTITPSSDFLSQLAVLYSQLNVKNLPNLKDPSQDRFFDGAPIATFSITTKEATYSSVAFDGGNPPAEIKDIVNKLIEISEKKQ